MGPPWCNSSVRVLSAFCACAIAAVASCAPTPAPVSSRVGASAPAQTAVGRAREAPPRTTTRIERPTEVACTLRSSAWIGSLELLPGVPYASVFEADATMTIARAGTTAHVLVSADGVELEGVLRDPPVYLRRPIALAGFVVPYSDTALGLGAQHDPGRINVSLDVTAAFSDPQSVSQELSCDDVSTTRGVYDVRAFVKTPDAHRIVPRGAPLRLTRGGPVAARIVEGNHGLDVHADGAGRVVLDADIFVAVGYVAREAFIRPNTLRGSHRSRRPHVRPQREPHDYEGLTPQVCAFELPLIAQAAGQRAIVGHLAAGRPFLLDNPEGAPEGLVPIDIVADWLTSASGAILVDEHAIHDCPPGQKIPGEPAHAHF